MTFPFGEMMFHKPILMVHNVIVLKNTREVKKSKDKRQETKKSKKNEIKDKINQKMKSWEKGI